MATRGGITQFHRWEREAQQQAFFAWLPKELHQAPGIDWTQLPAEVMGYCIRTIGTSPDAAYLAMAAATAFGAITSPSLLNMLSNLKALFHTLRFVCGMQHLSDLRRETLWNEFAAKTSATMSRSRQLSWYSAVSTRHYPGYLRRLEAGDYFLMQLYQMPVMPNRFLRHVGSADELNNSSLQRWQPVRDTLVPLFPLLRQTVLLRKELAERMVDSYRQAAQQISTGASLPVAFQHDDTFPELLQQGETGEIALRDMTMRFLLWTKRSWVLAHQDHYREGVIREAEQARGVYSPEHDRPFVQYSGDVADLLWFGDLMKERLLQNFQRGPNGDPTYEERWHLARSLGFPRGCYTQQPGLLRGENRWFAENTREGDLLFEPEAVYRGIVYGAALATLAMTNGGSVSELLQVSADRWQSSLEGRKQLLLPDGAKSNNERRLFPILPEVEQLLEEIEQGLVEVFGEVPVIAPAQQNSKSDRLEAERYLFQWHKRAVDRHDAQVLVRFLFHGLHLVTSSGTPINLSTELIRYGGNLSTEERGQELLRIFGFNHLILKESLSFSSLRLYCRDFYAYWQFAGSREAALQPETLARWISSLSERRYSESTINRMVAIVQHIMRDAGSKGYIDLSVSAALQTIEKIPTPHQKSRADRKEMLYP
jgi:hypothetical protein